MQIFTAYIDAASVSIAFAAIAGVAVTVGAAVAVYFRRAKHAVSEKLGIDENRNKEVEGELTGGFGEEAKADDVMTAVENTAEEKAE